MTPNEGPRDACWVRVRLYEGCVPFMHFTESSFEH